MGWKIWKVPTAVLLVALIAAATAQAAQTGGLCSGPAFSAQNQYCENVPAPTGHHSVLPGSPTVGQTLPPRVAAAIATGRAHRARKALLNLPATIPQEPLGPPVQTSGWSLSLQLILLLAALVLALAGAAEWRRRRRRAAAAEAAALPA
jgi:hypothetical protein